MGNVHVEERTDIFLLGRNGIYLCIYGHVSRLSFFAASACVQSRLLLTAMAFTMFCCFLLLAALGASAQSTCTTLQPVFELPLDATSTVYGSTITSTSSVDCAGCSLIVSTFRAIVTTSVNNPRASYSSSNQLTDRMSATDPDGHHN